MSYTEEDIRNAFKAGLIKGKHQSYFDAPLDEDEYLIELTQSKIINGDCLHPYHAVTKDKITELCRCSICKNEFYV